MNIGKLLTPEQEYRKKIVDEIEILEQIDDADMCKKIIDLYKNMLLNLIGNSLLEVKIDYNDFKTRSEL